MSVLGGKYCAVNGLSTVARWTLNETTNVPRFRASNLRGGTGRRRGVYDYSGVIEGYGEMPPVMPSEYFDFTGFTAPTTGARGTAGQTKEATNAIVDQITMAWNWNTAEILKWTINFSCGEPTRILEGTASTVDNSDPTIFEVCGLYIEIGEEGDEVEWTNIQSALLTINAENDQFVNSSTGCVIGRRPGPIDWTLALTEDNEGKFNNFDPGEQGRFRLFTVPVTRYWLLEWGHYVDRTNLRVDAETGEVISQQHNWAMNCVDDVDDTEIGVIARPGETGGTGGSGYWWPDQVIADTLPFTVP